jgi:hypothetical protein
MTQHDIATERVFREDANGINRLVAGPGDVIPVETVTPGVVATPAETPLTAPIEGYDDLSEAQVLEKLPELSSEDLAAVQAYERARQARGSITTFAVTSKPVDLPPPPTRTRSRKPAPQSPPAPVDYDNLEASTVEVLQAEVDRRREAGETIEVEGTGQDGNVLEADLVKALQDAGKPAA